MSTLVKVQKKGQVTIPTHLRTRAGINDGDLIEATFARGKIILEPKIVRDRAQFPNAKDEYTPDQRRVIDARLDESDKDFKAGRSHGPFDTHAEFIASLHAEAKKLNANKSKRPAR